MIGRITPRKLNADTDDRSLEADEMKKAINISVDSDSDGDGGVVKFSDGNTSILPSDGLAAVAEGINTVIGSVSDEELGVVYFFVHNSNSNHGVYAYSANTNTYRKIFSSPTLNFDENGFVKGDIVRIKRQYELEAPEIIIGQGGSGGADVDTGTGGGGGQTDPIGELFPETIRVNVGRDLYPLIELDANLFQYYGASISNSIGPVGFEAVITGTYTPSNEGAMVLPEQVVFYGSSSVDLNLAQEEYTEIVVRTLDEGIILDSTSGQKSLYIELDRDVFVHPDVTTDGTLELNVVLRPVDLDFKINAIGGVYGSTQIYSAEVPYEKMTETILFSNVTNGEAFSVGADSDNHPVLRGDGKTRLNITVGDVYGDKYLVYAENSSSDTYLLDFQKKILSTKLDEESGTITYSDEDGVETIKLVDRIVPMKVRIDYKDSPSYQAFKAIWEEQQDANTSDVYNVPADAADLPRNQRSVPEDTTTDVVYFTFCPYTMKWEIVGTRPSGLSYQNADESFKTYPELISESLAWYSLNSESITPWVGNTGPYGATSSMYSQMTSQLGSQWFNDGGYTYPNWIAVQVFVGGTGSCSIPSAEDVFNPVLVVAPVVQYGETQYKQPRIVYPFSTPADDLSDSAALNALAADASFEFAVNMPMAWHHGSLENSTEEYDFILVSYNLSDYDAFKGAEDVVFDNYDAHIHLNSMSSFLNTHYFESVQTDGELHQDNNLQIFADEDRVLPYAYSVSGNPADIQSLRGRRVRAAFADSQGTWQGVSKIVLECIIKPDLFAAQEGNRFTGIVLTPYKETEVSLKFCYGFGTSCANSAELPAPRFPVIPDAPVVSDGDQTAQDNNLTVTTTAQATDPTKEVIPESTAPSLPAEETTTSKTTKETIKKKY